MTENDDNIHLIHCIYSSAATIKFSDDDIIALLEKSRTSNSQLDVTGMLLFEDGSFLQILEGTPEAIADLYKKISADKRHNNVTKIIQEPIEERSFSEWTMGYSGITRKELKEIDGLNDFFSSKKCYTELDENRTKKLLKAFKDGKWRASLQ